MSSGLFACEKITFEEPFSGGKQVKVFVSPGNSTNGAAVWVESEDHSQFRACIYEYSDGSNAAAELDPCKILREIENKPVQSFSCFTSRM